MPERRAESARTEELKQGSAEVRKQVIDSVVCLVLLLIATLIPMQAKAAKDMVEVGPAEKQEIVARFAALRKDMHSVFASVSQEKQLAALKKKVHVEGSVIMAKPNMLKWDVVKPKRSITVIDGEEMTVFHPDLNEAQIYSLSDNFVASNTMNFFSAAMSGDLKEMEERFRVTILRNDGEIVFRLVPLSKIVSRYLTSVVIHYDELTGVPSGFEMTTPKGDTTVTRLTNVKINPALKPETFRIRLPKDVWVTNRLEPVSN